MTTIEPTTKQRSQLIQSVIANPDLTDSEAFALHQLLDPNATPEIFEVIRSVERRPAAPLTEDTALEFVMQRHDLLTILSELARVTFEKANGLRAIGYHNTAARLDKLAETLGDIHIPEVKTV